MKSDLGKKKIIDILNKSTYYLEVESIVLRTNLPFLWISGGFLRTIVWDYLFKTEEKPIFNDIDIIYIENTDHKISEIEIQNRLTTLNPQFNWSVKEQLNMATKNKHPGYKNINDALTYWVETATAIAINPFGEKKTLLMPFGSDDLLQGIVKPTTPQYKDLTAKRAEQKGWKKRWPKLIYAFE